MRLLRDPRQECPELAEVCVRREQCHCSEVGHPLVSILIYMSQQHPRVPYNQLRESRGNVSRTVELFALEKLDVKSGDAPDDVQVDRKQGKLILSFLSGIVGSAMTQDA